MNDDAMAEPEVFAEEHSLTPDLMAALRDSLEDARQRRVEALRRATLPQSLRLFEDGLCPADSGGRAVASLVNGRCPVCRVTWQHTDEYGGTLWATEDGGARLGWNDAVLPNPEMWRILSDGVHALHTNLTGQS